MQSDVARPESCPGHRDPGTRAGQRVPSEDGTPSGIHGSGGPRQSLQKPGRPGRSPAGAHVLGRRGRDSVNNPAHTQPSAIITGDVGESYGVSLRLPSSFLGLPHAASSLHPAGGDCTSSSMISSPGGTPRRAPRYALVAVARLMTSASTHTDAALALAAGPGIPAPNARRALHRRVFPPRTEVGIARATGVHNPRRRGTRRSARLVTSYENCRWRSRRPAPPRCGRRAGGAGWAYRHRSDWQLHPESPPFSPLRASLSLANARVEPLVRSRWTRRASPQLTGVGA